MPEFKMKMGPKQKNEGEFEKKRREATRIYREKADFLNRYSDALLKSSDVAVSDKIRRLSEIRAEYNKQSGEYLSHLARIEAEERRYFDRENGVSGENSRIVYGKYSNFILESEGLSAEDKMLRLQGFNGRINKDYENY